MTPHTGHVPYLPARIEGLATLAKTCGEPDRDARGLFRSIDPTLSGLTRHNPLDLLCRVHPERVAACASDGDFLRRYDDVMTPLHPRDRPAGHLVHPDLRQLDGRPVAYFCAEFGLHSSVPIYWGGLGVLAGDHCKAASRPRRAPRRRRLMYMKGYFDQRLRLDGWQEDSDDEFDLCADAARAGRRSQDAPYLATVETSGRPVHVRRLADDGRPRADLPARHQPRAATTPTTARS